MKGVIVDGIASRVAGAVRRFCFTNAQANLLKLARAGPRERTDGSREKSFKRPIMKTIAKCSIPNLGIDLRIIALRLSGLNSCDETPTTFIRRI